MGMLGSGRDWKACIRTTAHPVRNSVSNDRRRFLRRHPGWLQAGSKATQRRPCFKPFKISMVRPREAILTSTRLQNASVVLSLAFSDLQVLMLRVFCVAYKISGVLGSMSKSVGGYSRSGKKVHPFATILPLPAAPATSKRSFQAAIWRADTLVRHGSLRRSLLRWLSAPACGPGSDPQFPQVHVLRTALRTALRTEPDSEALRLHFWLPKHFPRPRGIPIECNSVTALHRAELQTAPDRILSLEGL
eukprot:s4235_g3.t1